MTAFLLIPLCFLAGFIGRRLKKFPDSSAHALNAFVIHLSLPALILAKFSPFASELSLDRSLLLPISMAWINFALAWLVFQKVGTKLGWSRGTIGALVLTTGLGNTSFIGFPLLGALMGSEAIKIGILVDQPGSFLVLATLGVTAASLFAGEAVTSSQILKRVLSFPPFAALCLALGWAALDLPGKSIALPVLEQLSSTLVPLALFAVGFQLPLSLKIEKRLVLPIGLALLFKLFLAPVFFSFLYFGIIRNLTFASHVTVLESAMAPMITSAVVATEFELHPELANLVVSLGILASFITVPLWHWAIN